LAKPFGRPIISPIAAKAGQKRKCCAKTPINGRHPIQAAERMGKGAQRGPRARSRKYAGMLLNARRGRRETGRSRGQLRRSPWQGRCFASFFLFAKEKASRAGPWMQRGFAGSGRQRDRKARRRHSLRKRSAARRTRKGPAASGAGAVRQNVSRRQGVLPPSVRSQERGKNGAKAYSKDMRNNKRKGHRFVRVHGSGYSWNCLRIPCPCSVEP
jgi:hypothetical protein